MRPLVVLLAIASLIACDAAFQRDSNQNPGICGLNPENCGGGYCCPSWAYCTFNRNERNCTPKPNQWP